MSKEICALMKYSKEETFCLKACNLVREVSCIHVYGIVAAGWIRTRRAVSSTWLSALSHNTPSSAVHSRPAMCIVLVVNALRVKILPILEVYYCLCLLTAHDFVEKVKKRGGRGDGKGERGEKRRIVELHRVYQDGVVSKKALWVQAEENLLNLLRKGMPFIIIGSH